MRSFGMPRGWKTAQFVATALSLLVTGAVCALPGRSSSSSSSTASLPRRPPWRALQSSSTNSAIAEVLLPLPATATATKASATPETTSNLWKEQEEQRQEIEAHWPQLASNLTLQFQGATTHEDNNHDSSLRRSSSFIRLPMMSTNLLFRGRSLANAKWTMTLCLLALSGMVEAFCFRYFKCFPNMMTGNTVRLLDSLVDSRWMDALLSFALIAAYTSGGIIYKMMVQMRQQIDSPSKTTTTTIPTTLDKVARLSILIFGIADVVHFWMLQRHHGPFALWRLPLLSLGFGLVNAATTDVVGTVTNAVTGQWTKLGMGLAETTILLQQHSSTKTSSWTTPAWALTSFAGGIVATSVLLRVVERIPWWNRLVVPPLGLTLGVVYAALLTGYSQYLVQEQATTETVNGM